jgi:hypothetical protein
MVDMIGNLKSCSLTKIILLIVFFIPTLCPAAPYYGINFTYALLSHTPEPLYGYQVMLNYAPPRFIWKQLSLYFDGGFSHFRATHAERNSIINIYSAAPVFRYTAKPGGFITPYLEASIGLAYLNRTRIEKRNLGIHFSFQDRLGMGAFIGKSEKFSVGVHAVHYSNAHFSSHNSGITIPFLLDVGYRF